MKNILLTSLYCLFSFVVFGQTSFELTNTSNINRDQEVVAIPWELIKAKYANIDTSALVIINKKQKNLLFINLNTKEKKKFKIYWCK